MSEAFAQAFLAAQKEFPTIAKGRTADMGNYKYSYADLGDVLDSALPILHKHGLALSQPPVSAPGQVGVLTRLIHESGHVEDCGELLLSAGNTPQSAGSALTYARRYAACAALGIVADEDDDGRAASRHVAVESPPEDAGAWLAGAVQIFGEWTADQRRETVSQVMKELGVSNPMSMSDAKRVHKQASEIYYQAFPPTGDEAPF